MTRFPPHNHVRIRVTPAGMWLWCDLCSQPGYAASDPAAQVLLADHTWVPDPEWMARMDQAAAELAQPVPGTAEAKQAGGGS